MIGGSWDERVHIDINTHTHTHTHTRTHTHTHEFPYLIHDGLKEDEVGVARGGGEPKVPHHWEEAQREDQQKPQERSLCSRPTQGTSESESEFVVLHTQQPTPTQQDDC